MNENLSIFNWSLRKLIATETDSFNRAKIKIIYLFLLVSLAKCLVVIPASLYHHQYIQLTRTVFLFVVLIISLKGILSNKSLVRPITHIYILLGIMLVYSSIFAIAQTVNIITIQFVFMIILSSFYMLDKRFGIWYSCLTILPVILHIYSPGWELNKLSFAPEAITHDTSIIIIVLNFVTIVGGHYLYHEAFQINISEKEHLNKNLKEQNEKIKKFSFITSHELRHEFSKMRMLIENAKSMENTAENMKRFFRDTEVAANNMNEVLAELNNDLILSKSVLRPVHFPPLSQAQEICLVDDDIIFNQLNEWIISSQYENIPVKIFVDADAAISHLESNPVINRYIFLDLNMPLKSGWEFLETYSKHEYRKNSPVIILSSSIDPDDIEKSMSYKEVLNFFSKPLTEESLGLLK